MDSRGKDKVICIMFTLFLAIGFLLCAFYPKKEYSDSERRKLYSKNGVAGAVHVGV